MMLLLHLVRGLADLRSARCSLSVLCQRCG